MAAGNHYPCGMSQFSQYGRGVQSRLLMVAFAALLGWKRVLSCQSQYGDEYLFRPNLHLYSTA